MASGESVAWGIVNQQAPATLMGNISLWRILKDHYRAEIGYMLLPKFWNKGFMKEALSMVVDFGFLTMGLHSIEARINPSNKASAALLLTSGFTKEAYFREDYFFNGQFGDTEVYSKLNNNGCLST